MQLDPVFPSLPSLSEQVPVKTDNGTVVLKGLSKARSSFCLNDGVSQLPIFGREEPFLYYARLWHGFINF